MSKDGFTKLILRHLPTTPVASRPPSVARCSPSVNPRIAWRDLPDACAWASRVAGAGGLEDVLFFPYIYIYTYTYTHTLGKNQTDPTDFYILNSSYIGNVIIPTDELLLFRGVFPQAPTRWHHPMSHIYQPVHQHWLVGCDIGWSRGFCSTLDCAAVWFPQVRSNKEEQ